MSEPETASTPTVEGFNADSDRLMAYAEILTATNDGESWKDGDELQSTRSAILGHIRAIIRRDKRGDERASKSAKTRGSDSQ